MFLDLQLLLLLPYGFCPGDHTFCAFVEERAGDGELAGDALSAMLCSPASSSTTTPWHLCPTCDSCDISPGQQDSF